MGSCLQLCFCPDPTIVDTTSIKYDKVNIKPPIDESVAIVPIIENQTQPYFTLNSYIPNGKIYRKQIITTQLELNGDISF